MSEDIGKEEVLDRLISMFGYALSLRLLLDIAYEAGADAGAEEAAGCGRVNLRKAFQDRVDVIMKSRRLHEIDPRGCF